LFRSTLIALFIGLVDTTVGYNGAGSFVVVVLQLNAISIMNDVNR
jgi:hypothetical protein